MLGKEEKEYEYYLNKVKNYHDLVTEITLDIGKTSGVKEGLVLKSTENPDKYPADIIIVKKVLKDTSIAEFVEDIPKPSCGKPEHEKCRAITPTRFKIGHKFTTTGDW